MTAHTQFTASHGCTGVFCLAAVYSAQWKLLKEKITDWNTFCLCVGCVEDHECYAGRSWRKKLLQCESGLVVSLGTERRLSISEPSAGREWHWPIKRREGFRRCASQMALVNYLQELFQSPQWRMQLKSKRVQTVIKASGFALFEVHPTFSSHFL